jgi:serine protease
MKTHLRKLACFVAFILLATACSKDEMPVADFTSVVTGKTVQFTNTSTNGKSYYWTFGDGGVSESHSPSYTYAKAGTYNVVLRVVNLDASLEGSFKTAAVIIP